MKKLALICLFMLALVSCKKAELNNPQFFPKGTETVSYRGFVTTDEGLVEGDITAALVNKGKYMDGELFELVFSAPVGRLEKLGDFYVENEKIYKVNLVDLANMTIICDTQDLSVVPSGGKPGLRYNLYVAEGNCRFTSYDDSTEDGYFEEMTWEAGIGLVDFTCGKGDGRDAVVLEMVR